VCDVRIVIVAWDHLEVSTTWGWWLLQIGTPIILAVGIPGNILTLLVMKTHRYRVKSYSHYFCALAVFDSLVLIGKAMRRIDSALTESGHFGNTLFIFYLEMKFAVLKKETNLPECKPRRESTMFLRNNSFSRFSH
jgi:hypothetical protein